MDVILPPAEGTLWRHIRSGNVYEVQLVTNTGASKSRQEEYPITVVYKLNGSDPLHPETKWWSKTLDKWYESFILVPDKS